MIVRLANALLRAVLPPGESGTAIRDDLTDELRLRRMSGHRRWSSLWFGWEAIKIAGHFVMPGPGQQWGGGGMFGDMVRQNMVFTFRSLRRQGAFTLVAVVTLGVGIGASSAAFSAVNGIVFRPLPYDEAHEVVSVETRMSGLEDPGPSSVPDFIDWKERLTTLESLAAVQPTSIITVTDNGAERVPTAEVSPDFLRVFRVVPAVGRNFSDDEYFTGADLVILVSHESWVRRFGSEPNLDRLSIVTADGPNGEEQTRRVVGLLPMGFVWPASLGEEPEFLTPMPVDGAASEGSRGTRTVHVVGRLASNQTLDLVAGQAEAVSAELAARYPETWTDDGVDHRIVVTSLHRRIVGRADTKLFIFWGASGLLLVIAMVNVASLLFARSTTRHGEMSVRTALGASRAQLAGLLLTESLAISLMGGALGTGLAYLATSGLRSFGAQILPRLGNVAIDGRVLLFGLVVSLVVGVLLGVVPALTSGEAGPAATLRSGGRFGIDARRGRSRSLLLAFEAALALILLTGSGLLVNTYANLHRQPLGFEPAGLATARIRLNSSYADGAARVRFVDQLQDRVSGLPGVEAVGFIQDPPVSFYGWWLPEVYGDAEASAQPVRILGHTITPGYMAAAGIPVTRGRDIHAGDADGPLVALLSESAAESLWPGEDPLERQISLGPGTPALRVVGVVGDVRQAELDSEMRAAFYVPFSKAPLWGSMVLMLRMAPGIPVPASAVRTELAAIDVNIPIGPLSNMTETVAAALTPARFNASILAFFAGVALLLAMVGIYGVLQFLVGERQREIGVRLALGAEPNEIIVDVWRSGMIPTGLGALAGVVVGAGLSRVMASLLFGVPAFDWVTPAVATAALALAATVACVIPALRASRIHPIVSLRSE